MDATQTTPLTDLELLDAVARHDQAAFNELFARYQNRAYSLAFHIVQNAALAEEAVQEAMLSIWLATHVELGSRTVADWILGTVAGKALNVRRGQKKQSRRETRSRAEAAPARNCKDDAERDETLDLLRKHLCLLPERDGQLLACCFGANLSHEKIGELLGIPRRTVSDRIQSALQSLRLSLSQAGVLAGIPAVGAQAIHSALTGGHVCPAVTLAARPPAPRARSTRRRLPRATRQSYAGAAALATVVALSITAAAIYSANRPAEGAKPEVYAKAAQSGAVAPQPVISPAALPVTTVSNPAPVLATQPVPERIYRHWDFAQRPENLDIQTLGNNWSWNGGLMASSNGQAVIAFLPTLIRKQNVKLTVRLRAEGRSTALVATWLNERSIAAFYYQVKSGEYRSVHQTMTSTLLFTSTECLQWYDGRLNTYRRFDEDWPGNRLMLQLESASIESITLESVSDAEAKRDIDRSGAELNALRQQTPQRFPGQALPASVRF